MKQIEKTIYYKLIKIIINILDLVKRIIDLLMKYNNFFNYFLKNIQMFFRFEFLLLLSFFIGIKLK